MANEYAIQGDYGQGFETLLTEENEQEANDRLKEYNINEENIPHRLLVIEKE